MNLRQLISSTRRVKADGTWNPSKDFRSRNFGAIMDIDLEGSYNAQHKTLTVYMTIKSSSQKYRGISSALGDTVISTHSVAISFKGIEQIFYPNDEIMERMNVYNARVGEIRLKTVEDFVKLAQKEHPELVPTKINDDGVILRTKIDMSTECRVRCTCAHYYYTFAYYNAQAGVHIGETPASYHHRRKQQWKWTGRNKNGVPGMCKHLQLLVSYIIRPDNGINGDIEYANKTFKVNALDSNEYNTSNGKKSSTVASRTLRNYEVGKNIPVNKNIWLRKAYRELQNYNSAVREQKAENKDMYGAIQEGENIEGYEE